MARIWTLYKFSIPTGEYYFGATRQLFRFRRDSHKKHLRDGTHSIKSLQEWFTTKGKLSDIVWDELEKGDEYKIRCAEHYIIKDHIDDPKCLNTNIPWPPHIVKVLIEEGKEEAQRQLSRERSKESNKKYDHSAWQKTPQGKLNVAVRNAIRNIKDYTKQNRPDMVERWEIKLKERLYERDNRVWDR